jgi:leader peptidase (prepilin peptidase)/N-methyltransferase
MNITIFIVVLLLGLAWGSFINALVWRLSQIDRMLHSKKKPRGLKPDQLSILKGRSMCPNCHTELRVVDLIPIFSWLSLRGKCRYCGQPISVQYPLVEILTMILFVLSYVFWPLMLSSVVSYVVFGLWLAELVILIALSLYDIKWMELPDKLVATLGALAVIQAIILIVSSSSWTGSLINHLIAIVFGGGIFWVIYVASKGTWIGGGDVKLGFVLGLIVGQAGASLLMLFLAALAGTLVSVPYLLGKKLGRRSQIPFGPFLCLACAVVVLFGQSVMDWYTSLLVIG